MGMFAVGGRGPGLGLREFSGYDFGIWGQLACLRSWAPFRVLLEAPSTAASGAAMD